MQMNCPSPPPPECRNYALIIMIVTPVDRVDNVISDFVNTVRYNIIHINL